MSLWTFKCYISEFGVDYVGEWYENLPPKAQAKLDTILEHFRDTPHTEWSSNHFFPLTGHEGIYEIRFRISKVLYRPLGCFGPNRGEFTFLVGAREHGDDFEPRRAPETADERRITLSRQKERAHECSF